MSAVQSHDPVIISLTENAATKVKSLIAEEGNDQLKLRVFVTGGGCSGFQYGFSFEEAVAEDDTVVNHKGAELVVDSLSYQYLVGSRVDYVENLEGSRFVVNNPLATTTCGCGSSFSI
ncbi:MAG: iron-sulfur cluster insertion protein ErpA [Pseudomonadales bacterium]|nr:iron-sulfur cluster insertion protein ErpA [Pseudomonadales bacterium]